MVVYMCLLSFIPSFIIAYIIYKTDKVEKEPIGELLRAFGMGVFSVIITLGISFGLGIQDYNTNEMSFENLLLYVFLGVALVEEFSKWVSTRLFFNGSNSYNYLYDGIVYSIYVSLGFATIENFLYLVNADISLVIIRSFITVPAHVFFAVFMGYYLSKYKESVLKKQKNYKYLLYSILIPVTLHGIFDTLLLSSNFILLIIFLIYVLFLYVFSIKKMILAIKEEHSFDNMNK